jgi:hypothetical protein
VLDLSTLGASAVAGVLLDGNVTSIVLPLDGVRLDLLITQDATGGRTVAWPAEIVWPSGTDPVITATANRSDWISLIHAGVASWRSSGGRVVAEVVAVAVATPTSRRPPSLTRFGRLLRRRPTRSPRRPCGVRRSPAW